jgi:hypothetical protein
MPLHEPSLGPCLTAQRAWGGPWGGGGVLHCNFQHMCTTLIDAPLHPPAAGASVQSYYMAGYDTSQVTHPAPALDVLSSQAAAASSGAVVMAFDLKLSAAQVRRVAPLQTI